MNLSKYCADPGKSPDGQTTSEHDAFYQRRKKNHKPRKFNRGILWTIIIVVVILVLASVFLVLPMVSKKAQHSALICMPENATVSQLKDSIAKYLGEDYAKATQRAFRIVSGQGDREVRHGAWRIEAGMTPFQAARLLSRGGQSGIQVTLNGQRTKEDVARVLASKLEFSEEDFLNALKDEKLMNDFEIVPEQAIVYFLEDTYEFYWTSTPRDVVETVYKNYRKFWNNERRQKAEDFNLSRRDIVILASIVDAETNKTGEKGTIARLYLNRLKEGMKLQSDPTVIYATGDFSIKRVGGDMLDTDSPYNTYKYEGLPPGPIRLTSAATIDAILTSRPNNYLYMCADESLNGSHKFAVTYEEHLENSKRYRQALDKMGIELKGAKTEENMDNTNP